MTTRPRHKIVSDLEQCQQCISKLEGELSRIEYCTRMMWCNFDVYATPESSMYSRCIELSLGERYFGMYDTIVDKLARAKDDLVNMNNRMNNRKWYTFTGKSDLVKKIAILEEDTRILSKFVRIHDIEKDNLSGIAKEKQLVKDRLSRMYECGRQITNELNEYDMHKLIDDCDKLCPEFK